MRRNARIRSNLVALCALSAVAVPAAAGALSQSTGVPVPPTETVATPTALGATGHPLIKNADGSVPLGGFGFSQGSSILWEDDATLARDLDGMVAAGATWIALDVDWPSIQPVGPDTWNWTNTDRVLTAARARGLEVLGTIAYTPPWARPANTVDKHVPRDPAEYATFAAAVATRYAPMGIHAWQLWNEPNSKDFFAPSPDATAYAAMLIAAADAVHAVDPGAVVMNGGLAPAATIAGRTVAPNEFLLALYQAGVGGHLDAVAMHPYTFPFAPTVQAPWNPFYMLGYTHLIMSAFGDGGLPIWGTEAGYGTGRDGQSSSDTGQAKRLAELVAAWRALSFEGNLFIYGYRDLASGSASVWDNMGIVRHNFSPKPGATAFRKAVVGTIAKRAPRNCIRGIGVDGSGRRRGC